MNKKAFIYLFMLVLVCCHNTFAQRYPFYNLNVENGLIQSQATSLVQDKFGHLWIGTIGGLSRYDGKNFTNYTVRNGMLNNTVTALNIDRQGNIWIGSPKGISKYDGKQFKHFVFQSPEKPNINAVSSITATDNGVVWCIAGNKLYTINKGVTKKFEIPDTSASIFSVLPDNNEVLVSTNKSTVYRYKNSKWDSLTFNEPQLINKPYVFSMHRDSKQRVWLGTNGGLYTIENDKITVASIRSTKLYGIQPILSITEDKQHNIWLGTVFGAYRIKDSSLSYCSKQNGLTDNTINQITTDAEGNVWMASDGQGVFRFSGAQFSIVGEGSGLPSAQIMSIGAMGNKLYLGTYDAGLYVFEDGKVHAVAMPDKRVPSITVIHVRHSNEMWLGTRNSGLWKYNGSSFKTYTVPTIPSNQVRCMYTDPQNRLWIGFSNGASVYQNDTFHKINVNGSAVESFISIGVDSVLIATTGDGLQLYNAGNTYPFKTNSSPDSASTQCMIVRGDELWLGTSDNGLICYNLKTKQSIIINKSNGLQSDFIYNISLDNDGNIWAGTGYGIHKITMHNNKYTVHFYGKEQGMTGMESNHNAVFKMPDGSIWFGTTNGAVHYNPQSKIINPAPQNIVLQSVKVFGETIGDTTFYDSTDAWYGVPHNLHLPYRKNNLTFTFQGITLSGAEQLKYRYKIEELENRWSDWSNVNSVTYSALPSGKYTLVVECMAGDSSGVKTLQYPFEIITPFHKTGWFRLAVLAGCILLGITIQYIVNKRKQNRQALMERLRREEQNKVRQRTAEDFHDEVGNKLTRINVLTNVLKNKLGDMTPDSKRIIEQIQDNTGQLYSGTRDILWSLKPANDSLYEILHRLRDFGGELFQDTEIDFIFTGTDERWKQYKVPLDSSRNLIMIFKEALNNCLKYAGATRVELKAELKDNDILHLELKDNGKGFDLDTIKKGHGIDNMNVRAKRLHGKLYIDANSGKGTVISLSFRLAKQAM